MKKWKIFFATICFVIINSFTVLADEWCWETNDYQYELIKNIGYEEWNDTDVVIHNDESTSYVLFKAGTIEGELAEFDVSIYDKEQNNVYRYSSNSSMSHNLSFGQIDEIALLPGVYRLSIVAKGFVDQSLDDYTLYVSYKNHSDNEDVIVDKEDNVEGDGDKDTENVESDDDSKQEPTSTKITPPKKVAIQSANRLKNKKKAKVIWKKLKGSNIKYEITYSTSKKFAVKKTKTLSIKKNKITITKLEKNKKYYVKVRGYIIVDGEKTYGKYSKTIKIKKAK